MTLRNVTRETILTAIAAYNELGSDAFHARFGTSASTRYVLRHDGRDYPSKAIIAAAAGLSPKSFSGGPARLEKIVERCGFILGQLAFGFAAAVATMTAAAPAQRLEPVGVSGSPAIYFASGSNRPADIRGFSAVGQAIGVAAPEVSPNAENELYRLAGSGLPVFVDSGAFSEVTFGPTGPAVTHPISAEEWTKRLNLYARLAAVYQEAGAAHDLYLVAPDMVGFQAATLERLTRYRTEVRALIQQGVNVLVVSQKGQMSQAEFDLQVEGVLGTSEYVRALPCKKGATSPIELQAFVAARKPAHVHLLGMGVKNRDAAEALAAVQRANPGTVVSMDSCLIAATSVRGTAGKPRILVAMKDLARELIAAGKLAATMAVQEAGIILAFGQGLQLDLCV